MGEQGAERTPHHELRWDTARAWEELAWLGEALQGISSTVGVL